MELGEFKLTVVGDGPYLAELKQLLPKESVVFTGFLSDESLRKAYASADVFVFPSRWETFGLAAVEAAMADVPVVASDIDVLREVLATLDARSVRFVATDNALALAAAVRSFLADPQAKVRAR